MSDRSEILLYVSKLRQFPGQIGQTDVNFDILVLKVEGVLPDINTDDGNMSEKGILVCSGYDFKSLGRRVETLKKKDM